ncbi:MAG: hypothetical protein NC419_03335 [Muribaculaceae bacterium]|nr:hypothetical protein [Muribaculaceae bacterium]
MPYLTILNFIGIIACMMENKIFTYFISYVVAIFFFTRYSKIAWRYIYEPFVSTETIAGLVDIKLMNTVAAFICITGIFLFICFNFGSLCLVASILQCIVFHVIDLFKKRTYANGILLIILLMELLFAVGLHV